MLDPDLPNLPPHCDECVMLMQFAFDEYQFRGARYLHELTR